MVTPIVLATTIFTAQSTAFLVTPKTEAQIKIRNSGFIAAACCTKSFSTFPLKESSFSGHHTPNAVKFFSFCLIWTVKYVQLSFIFPRLN